MVRFTAIQTDGFKSNDLPSTKIVIWPNKIPSSAAASLVIQSIFSFAPLLMQISRFLDLDTVLPSFPSQSEESHQTALCLEVAGRAEQHRSPGRQSSTGHLLPRSCHRTPARSHTQWVFPSGQYRQCISILPQKHLVRFKYLILSDIMMYFSSAARKLS